MINIDEWHANVRKLSCSPTDGFPVCIVNTIKRKMNKSILHMRFSETELFLRHCALLTQCHTHNLYCPMCHDMIEISFAFCYIPDVSKELYACYMTSRLLVCEARLTVDGGVSQMVCYAFTATDICLRMLDSTCLPNQCKLGEMWSHASATLTISECRGQVSTCISEWCPK